MEVGHVRMCVPRRLVDVLVSVRFRALVAAMHVLVMFVVDVAVAVHQAPVLVLVNV